MVDPKNATVAKFVFIKAPKKIAIALYITNALGVVELLFLPHTKVNKLKMIPLNKLSQLTMLLTWFQIIIKTKGAGH